MANCAAVNGAGHQCTWPEGHKKYGFVGITEPSTTSKSPAVGVHGYWNPLGFWEIWPAVPVPKSVSPP
jgi:hypothetical protein